MVPPSEAVADVASVPNYTERAIPWFYLLVVLDLTVGYARGKVSFEARDSMASITAGLMSRVTTMIGRVSAVHEGQRFLTFLYLLFY